MNDLIKTVREAVAQSKQGPWINSTHGIAQNETDAEGYRLLICKMYPHRESEAHLIANAPEWLLQLCDHAEALENDVEEWKQIDEAWYRINEEQLATNQAQAKEIERLQEALIKIRDRYAGEYGGHIGETEMRHIAHSVLSHIKGGEA